MKLYRIFALIERDMRKFFRNPALMMASMIFPLVQLVVLGYAFGGKITNVPGGAGGQRHRHPGRAGARGAERHRGGSPNLPPHGIPRPSRGHDRSAGGLSEGRSFISRPIFPSASCATKIRALLLSRTTPIRSRPAAFSSASSSFRDSLNGPVLPPLEPGESPASNLAGLFSPNRLPASIEFQTVEVYPYIDYIKYLLAGSISLSIFVTAMIGGGITFIDDKARGLHEGYLSTPLSKADLVLGLIGSGAIKGMMAGLIITIIGGLIAGIPRLWEPARLFYLILVLAVTSLAMISMMFLLMVRVSDPLVPRAIFGVLNTLLFFPSGAVYPTAGFPVWLRALSVVDPFTYVVDALKNLLLKDTGFCRHLP